MRSDVFEEADKTFSGDNIEVETYVLLGLYGVVLLPLQIRRLARAMCQKWWQMCDRCVGLRDCGSGYYENTRASASSSGGSEGSETADTLESLTSPLDPSF